MESKDNFQIENDHVKKTNLIDTPKSRKSEINEAADVFSDERKIFL
jgi:hypothetical protein